MSNPATVDETHTHGALAELIFLLRTYEHLLRTHVQLLEMTSQENQVLRAWNQRYHEQLYPANPQEAEHVSG